MRMKLSVWRRGLLLLALGFFAACTSTNTTPPPSLSGTTLFVTTQGDSMISALSVNVTTGALTAVSGSSVATGSGPYGLIFTPAGDAAFVSNTLSNDVSTYTVGTNGGLTVATASQKVGVAPHGIAVDAGGKFLFVANQGTSGDVNSGTVSAFSASGAALTEVAGSPFKVANVLDTVNPGPSAVAVTPDGKYLYTANQFTGTVSAFSIDGSGMLAQVATSPYTAGTAPSSLAITPNGNTLYSTNSGSSNISAFTICDNASPSCTSPDGSLTPVAGSPFSAGLGPVYVAISSTGNFAYVVDQTSNQLSGYKVGAGTGVLTATTPLATVSTGTHPSWVAISSGEQFVYVANNGAASISTFTMDNTTGALTVVGTPVTTGPQPSAIAF
jgi:6-phosphogluconolactonase